jgi:hypothetical protein
MQLPPVDRTVNGYVGPDLQPAAGGGGTPPRASRAETAAIQQSDAVQGGPSVKVELSAEIDEIIKIEKARSKADEDAKTKTAPTVTAADLKAQNIGFGNPAPADGGGSTASVSAATGTPQAGKVDGVNKNEAPAVAAKYAATGQAPGPDRPSTTGDATSKDWTVKPKTEEPKPPEPPKEPISKKLLEFLQSLWRAGGNAIDVAQGTNDILNPPNKQSDSPLTYADPSSKKTTGV